MHNTEKTSDAGLNPVAATPDANPAESGIDATLGGAAVGAATGTIAAGPVGTVIGATVGAIIGGLAGKGGDETLDTSREEAVRRENSLTPPDSSADHS
jgi:outer membrane lipoprotein SlyB